MGLTRSGLSTTVTALMTRAGYSGKTISYRLCNPNAENYLRGVGDKVVAKWEVVLHALGGEMVLVPIRDKSLETIAVPLTKATSKSLNERNAELAIKVDDYEALKDTVIGGMSVPLPRESLTVQALEAATAEIATRRCFTDHHVMALSGESHKAALSLTPGSGPAGLVFYQNVVEILGYSIEVTCDRLKISLARPRLPSDQDVERFRKNFLKQQQIYARNASQAKREEQADEAKKTKKRKASAPGEAAGDPEEKGRGHRSAIPTDTLIEMLSTSDEWSTVAIAAGVSRQAISAFAARHQIASPKEREKEARRRAAENKLRALKA